MSDQITDILLALAATALIMSVVITLVKRYQQPNYLTHFTQLK